ncbi:MAG: hypothetical protein ACOX0U_04735 [Oscillospiraceae bacterium]
MAIDSREGALAALREEDEEAALQSSYLQRAAGVPPYRNTETLLFWRRGWSSSQPWCGKWSRQSGSSFWSFSSSRRGSCGTPSWRLLVRKAKEGVDVRVMYDDVGCLLTLPKDYDKQLEQMGIKACVFNRFKPVLSPSFNNRDHRKICVVDGIVGFHRRDESGG